MANNKESTKQETSNIESLEITIPDIRYSKYDDKDEYLAFQKEERQLVKDAILNKSKTIESNEVFIKVQANHIIRRLLAKEDIDFLRRDFLSLIDDIIFNLNIAYELPNPIYLESKCTSYKNFIMEFYLIVMNNFDLQESIYILIKLKKLSLNSIKVFEMIAVYLNDSRFSAIVQFNENYIFDYDIQIIDKFLQVLHKEQLKNYKDFIIRTLQIDVSLNNVSKSELLTKIKDLYDYYIDIVPDSYQIYSSELIIHITHNALKNMGLKEDLIKFKNFLSSKKGVLKVEINHINDCSKKKIINQYVTTQPE